MNTAELLAEIRLAIEAVETWKPQHGGDLAFRGAMAYEGDHEGWRFLVVIWPAETINETPERAIVTRWGYDGTATRAPMFVKLTPELAELAGKRARKVS